MRLYNLLLLFVAFARSEGFAFTVGNTPQRSFSPSSTRLFSKKKQLAKAHHEKWQPFFDRLLKYKEQHGDFDVPVESDHDDDLGLWIREQRKQYKLLMDGKKARITRKRAVALERIGAIVESFPHKKKPAAEEDAEAELLP